MTYSTGATTILGTADTVDFRVIDWNVDEPRPEMEFGKPYLQFNAQCTVCKQQGEYRTHEVVTTIKHYWENRPLGQLNSRCAPHQRLWEANPTLDGRARMTDTAPADRESPARPVHVTVQVTVRATCRTQVSRSGSCFCQD